MGVQGDRVDHHSSRENTPIEDFFKKLILLQSQFVYENISSEDFGLPQPNPSKTEYVLQWNPLVIPESG